MGQQFLNTGTANNSGDGEPLRPGGVKINENFTELYSKALANRIVVNQGNVASTLGGIIDSTKEYFIDGVIDISNIEVEVPLGGINLSGYNFDLSQLVSSEDNYTMFTSVVGGSGDFIAIDVAFSVSGASSKLLDIKDSNGSHSFEITRVNFNNCTSLGSVDNYRQGFESGTGRFVGSPELTLTGVWSGGYFVESSIVRSLSNGVYSLYKAGVGFAMDSRFRSNQNIDLPSSASFVDFSSVNFPNPSTLDLEGCRITRNGVNDSSDSNLTPNIDSFELACFWKNNQGLPNTFIGGSLSVSTEVETIITTAGVFVDLLGTYTSSDLQHFDTPSNGQLRHLGDSPREYKVILDFILGGAANEEIDFKIVVWDDSASVFVDYKTVRRVVNNLQGGRDVCFFNFIDNIILEKNDYVKLMVAGVATTTNLTSELNSEFIVEER